MSTLQQGTKVARALLFVALVATAGVPTGCGDGMPPDRMRPAPPPDPAAYTSELQAERASRDSWFSTSPESPVPAASRATWVGLQYFDVDPGLRFVGPLVRRTSGRTFQMATTSGELRPCREVGYFELDLGAGVERLPVYQLLDQRQREGEVDLFVPFTDATTGAQTYPAGRYVDVRQLERGQFLLDFNLAYNPSCAYGGNFQCPVAPEENRLRAAVRAGEKGWDEAALGGSSR